MTQDNVVPHIGAGAETDGLKIIGAGFGRTGTRSLKEALEMLGSGPCYHMVEVFAHPEHMAFWEMAARGESGDWHGVFRGYQATVDWPGCTFYKQLMLTYPDARVLLSVRDAEKWYESVKSTIYLASHRAETPDTATRMPMVNQLVWHGTFHDRFLEKEYAISLFEQHNEEVKKYVPAEKLLVYDVKEGWEPLCTFLGVPVPDVPFPHLNDREDFLSSRMG
jgi:hypothetical protein